MYVLWRGEDTMISIYDITFYKYDEDGVEVLNEDGSTKLFSFFTSILVSISMVLLIDNVAPSTLTFDILIKLL